ncbi:MAG: protein kinase [Planctomycetes bacterium]|nr:protein kinase [Planctomycetota bacterium]
MIKTGSVQNKSALLEAAYDEYCRNQDSSQKVDVEQFLTRYSVIRSSLRRQIEVHDFLADRSHLVDLCQDTQWPEVDDKVFDFSVLEELGRGAFARVYLCRQSGVGERQVVVKFAAEGAYEADTLGRLSHPNIMPVHSVQFDELDNRSAICMPFRGRSTLCDLVDRTFSGAAMPSQGEAILSVARQDIGPEDQLEDCGPPDLFLQRCSYVDGIVHLGIQLADAIAHAHLRGIRHNDLKPSNVLLSESGRPMLLDFNLANSDATGSQTPGGTMPYMSPEQLAEFRFLESVEPLAIDERSDVFSLGVILFELLSGRLPFGEVVSGRSSGERAKAMAAAQARGPQSLRALNPQVDQTLARLIERCLCVDQSQRPRSAAALADALRRQLSWGGRSRRWTSRHLGLAIGAVLAVVLLSGSAAGYFAMREPYSIRQQSLALADLGQSRFEAAIAKLNPVLAEAPQNADALYLRGLARMRQKEYQQAIADLEAARRIRMCASRRLRRTACADFNSIGKRGFSIPRPWRGGMENWTRKIIWLIATSKRKNMQRP